MDIREFTKNIEEQIAEHVALLVADEDCNDHIELYEPVADFKALFEDYARLRAQETVFSDVLKFMQIAHADKLGSVPRIPPYRIRVLCQNLVNEEFGELVHADIRGDLVGIADAIADLIWVSICMALCYGIPIEKIWAAVALTNFKKFPNGEVIRRPEDGKILKPEGWQPPDIAGILRDAGYVKE